MSEMNHSLPGQADEGAWPEIRSHEAGQKHTARKAVKQSSGSLTRLARICAGGTAIAALARPVLAQVESEAAASAHLFTSSQVVGFSVVIGVISAALLSTLWLVRQRGNLENESREIRSALSDAHQRISQYQALIADKNRRIVVWDGNERPNRNCLASFQPKPVRRRTANSWRSASG